MKDLLISSGGALAEGDIYYSDGHQSHLLHEEEGFEAIVEILTRGTIGYLYTVHERGLEFTYILKGAIELRQGAEHRVLRRGDTYSHRKITGNIMFRALEDTELLEISTAPSYEVYQEDQKYLEQVLAQLQAVDGDTMEHCARVKNLSMGIAYYMRYDQSSLEDLFFAASFHDVGKSKIPVELLVKPGRLTDAEFEVMRQHSRYTYEMLLEHYGQTVANIAFEHHERLDGKGYPRGLRGDQIGMPARIICVADAYDAMVVTRPYREGMSREAALAELHRWEGAQFDPAVVAALEAYLEELEA